MTKDKAIHFGRFVQWQRVERGYSRAEFSGMIDVDQRQLARIESQPTPTSFETTLAKIARGLGMTVQALNDAWQNTPVPVDPPRMAKRAAQKSRMRFSISISMEAFVELSRRGKMEGLRSEDLAARMLEEATNDDILEVGEPGGLATPPEPAPAAPTEEESVARQRGSRHAPAAPAVRRKARRN